MSAKTLPKSLPYFTTSLPCKKKPTPSTDSQPIPPLAIAQSLYEKKYISYPRTASRYIPEDVFDELPTLITLLRHYPPYAAYALSLHGKPLFRRSVDASKVTDHYAMLPTENIPCTTLSKPHQLPRLVRRAPSKRSP